METKLWRNVKNFVIWIGLLKETERMVFLSPLELT